MQWQNLEKSSDSKRQQKDLRPRTGNAPSTRVQNSAKWKNNDKNIKVLQKRRKSRATRGQNAANKRKIQATRGSKNCQ